SDFSLFSPDHPIITKEYSKAYVHHLLKAEPSSAMRLLVLHNMFFYVRLMQVIRQVIEAHGV
ncbi:MAG: hypothetical protein ACRD4B_03370, partial [Acidobacteriota bacterium]